VFPQKIGYHDIADVEQFCNRIIHRSRLELSWHERDDLLAYLVETCWQLAEDFRPGGIKFSTYAGTTLPRRVIDWTRTRYGRTRWTNPNGHHGQVYERDRQQSLSLDDPLAATHLAQLVDATPPSCPDLRRILGERGSEPARRHITMGEGTDAEAA